MPDDAGSTPAAATMFMILQLWTKPSRRYAKPWKFPCVNIYARDGYRCQYCGAKCGIDQLTYDHVIPRSRGGRTTWDNIVSCCYTCNANKANRTPAEARMTLRA